MKKKKKKSLKVIKVYYIRFTHEDEIHVTHLSFQKIIKVNSLLFMDQVRKAIKDMYVLPLDKIANRPKIN